MRLFLGPNPRATLTRSAAIVAAAVIVFRYILLPVRLHGISMLPAYRDGQIDFANRLAYLWRAPARGDVVAIRLAGERVVLVKRIVGLPRERVEIAMGVVLIDGRPLLEPAVATRSAWNLPPLALGDDEYFVIGDNRSMSLDDHDFGRATRSRIVGKMLF